MRIGLAVHRGSDGSTAWQAFRERDRVPLHPFWTEAGRGLGQCDVP